MRCVWFSSTDKARLIQTADYYSQARLLGFAHVSSARVLQIFIPPPCSIRPPPVVPCFGLSSVVPLSPPPSAYLPYDPDFGSLVPSAATSLFLISHPRRSRLGKIEPDDGDSPWKFAVELPATDYAPDLPTDGITNPRSSLIPVPVTLSLAADYRSFASLFPALITPAVAGETLLRLRPVDKNSSTQTFMV